MVFIRKIVVLVFFRGSDVDVFLVGLNVELSDRNMELNVGGFFACK